jgi:heptaprenylglyceryl phosphate synthase
MKKKKLNSKNPKYMDKSQVTEVKKEKKLIREVKGCKIYAVKYL